MFSDAGSLREYALLTAKQIISCCMLVTRTNEKRCHKGSEVLSAVLS